jgi:single-strand DNA-binding protein
MSDLRMPDINRVLIAGRLTRDPELRYTPAGTAVCRLGIAAKRYFKGRDGEKKEDTTFVDVTVWEKTAEYCGQYLRQGRPILVEGRLRSESWEDKTTGQKRSKLDIQALRIQELDWSESRGSAAAAGTAGAAPDAAKPEPRPIEEPIPEDDIPF